MTAEPELRKYGAYQPTKLLATGASAQVWLADGPGGEVALKIARSDKHQESLQKEIHVLSLGEHPRLVKLLAHDPDGKWIALERVRGTMMDEWSKDQPPENIVGIAFELLEALEHLHAHGVVHGDLKPSNVIVDTDGRARLLDLGVATLPGEDVAGFRGTLGYAAPELLRGKAPTKETDVYGLGALLYTCLTGRTPFVAPDPAALTYLPLVSLPPPPATFRADVPASLNQLILALLARDAARRPSDLSRVKDALGRTMTRLAEPILGMYEEREELRRAVVGTADGEARVCVIYGPPGSGRRTLIAEAVEYARREGLPYLKGGDLKAAVQQLRESAKPSVMVHRAQHKGAQQVAKLVLTEHLPCLLLLHSDRPTPSLGELGAIQLTPSPLSLKDVTNLVRVSGLDPALAEQWWRDSLGLPIAVLGRIQAHRRRSNNLLLDPQDLPPESQKILELLHGGKPAKVVDLAEQAGLNEHVLLDHCEVLFAQGLVEAAEGGHSIVAVPQGR
ncbi:MAG: serine/threonine-protein kinase PknK [Alphaproteobacteria bacterium]|nr:serine/threonine-protein kinase PknK [Alphaproteobacteria bacterium]